MFGANGTVNILGKPRRIGEVVFHRNQIRPFTTPSSRKWIAMNLFDASLAEQQILPMIEEIFSILKAEASERGLENGEDL